MKSFKVRLAAAAAFTLGLAGMASAQTLPADQLAGIKFRAIQVDTSHYSVSGLSGLIASSAGGYPETLQQNVLSHAQKTFADRMTRDPKGAVLVIQIDSVMMTDGFSRYGGGLHGTSTDTSTDYMEGTGLIKLNGRVISTTPMLASRGARDSGVNGRERLDSLSDYYVSWLKKQMNL